VTGGEPSVPGRASCATEADLCWLRRAIELSRRCPPSQTAFAVGALVVAGDGSVLATGYSREGSPYDHAEEAALAKLGRADPRLGGVAGSEPAERGVAGSELALAGATLYSSLEPCAARASRPHPCAELVIEAGLHRVVIAWLEPPLFAAGGGARILRAAGVAVVEVAGLAAEARAVNAAVLGGNAPADAPGAGTRRTDRDR
jgi:diaminohydroxyphosphoribosylaminopyrimidine deaminase/5-amino-6-(5-phosphoribosylamino)uracil reductase